MSRPRALDLFCGAGGASMGLHRADRTCPRCRYEWLEATLLDAKDSGA